jgi:hypothetical protein
MPQRIKSGGFIGSKVSDIEQLVETDQQQCFDVGVGRLERY